MGKTDKESANRKNRTICLPFSQENYESILYDPIDCRRYIDQINAYFPELFPPEITKGYRMKEILAITDLGERSLLTGLIAQPPLNPL